MTIQYIFVYILMSLLFTGCSILGSRDKTTQTFIYKEIKGQSLALDLWLPKDKKESYPVVITVHGGSWSSRDRSDMNKIATNLAKNGFAVVNMSYRLAPQNLFPAPIEDVKSVVEWIEANQKAYKLDATRLNFWGYSAGSEISTLAAFQMDSKKVRAVINGAGPMDLSESSKDPVVIKYLGDGSREKLFEASPLNFVTQSTPPVFTYHSPNDDIVYFHHATRLKAKLDENKIENELYSVPVLGHILTFLISQKSIDKSIEFLKKHN